MGHVKRDLHKTVIKHDTIHPYTEDGINRLLKDIYKLHHEETYGGDINVTTIRIDLELALQSQCLTPKQRCAVALYYFCQLNYLQCCKLLGIAQSTLNFRLELALSNLSNHIKSSDVIGVYLLDLDEGIDEIEDSNIGVWLENVTYNQNKWWHISNHINNYLVSLFGFPKDRSYHKVENKGLYILNERQMRFRNSDKEISRPDVYRTYGNFGYTKSTEDGKKIKLIPSNKF